MAEGTPLTANTTIGAWLDDPTGGPLLRRLLGQVGVEENALAPARGMALKQLVAMSGGQLPQKIVDDMVREANGGEMPEAGADGAWVEQVTAGRFAGKTVVVTGAAGGIGRATAERVLAEGGRVVGVDVSEQRLADFAQAAGTDQLVVVTADLTRSEAVEAVMAAAGDRIDALANVAGINDNFSALHEYDDALWTKVFAVNVEAVARLSRAVLSMMLPAGRGSIVNVSSEAGLRGSASGVAYTASKHAVVGITRSAAFMYAREGIRVNAVAPGGVATGIQTQGTASEWGSARLTPARANMPSIADARQLAASICFLLSDDAVNINGAILPSDGGWSAV